MKNNKEQEQEIWKPVVGFEEKYEVSSLGNIMSNNWNNTGERRPVRTYLNRKTGYMYTLLQYKGKTRPTTVHRIVAEAFIPNPDNLEQVDHIDNDKTNNTVKNLRWVSRKFNNSRPHAIAMRKKNYRHSTHTHQFVKATKGGEVQYFKNAIQTAKALGCANATATKALNGQSHTVKGWVLEYVDRNLPECFQLRHELWLEKMNRISPSKQRAIELSMLAKERKERVNQKVKQIKEKYRLGFSLSHITKHEAVKEFRRLARAIVQIDPDGKPVREWENMARAENALGIIGIKQALFGFKAQIGGYVWKWKLAI